MSARSAVSRPPAPGVRAWGAVGLLSALYFISFVDRVAPALLVQPLKADLGVTDVQLGLLFGPAFAVFYAVVGLPLAHLADRGCRVALIAAGALIWGVCTLGSGLATDFRLLFLLRFGLAVGEAALTPAAYSLFGSLFTPADRVRAASAYSAVGVAGASAAYIIGATVIAAAQSLSWPGVDVADNWSAWRTVFVIVGLPPVAGAAMVWLLVREPAAPGQAAGGGLGAVLRRHGAMYAALFTGAALLQAVNAAYAAWAPEHLRRDLGWSITNAGLAYGAAGLLGASLGVLLTPRLAERWRAAGRPDGVVRAALLTGLIGAVAAALAPMAASGAVFAILGGVAAFGLYGSSTGLVVAMQTLAPAPHRASLVALLILSITLLGQGLGPPATPMLAGRLPGFTGLGGGLVLVALAAGVAGLALLAAAAAPVRRYLAEARDA